MAKTAYTKCIAEEMKGKKYHGKADVRKAFRKAAKKCSIKVYRGQR